jgi:AraC-like DNA-binding protein
MNQTASPELMRFSTDALPERDRMAIWHEVFGRQILKVQFTSLPGRRFFHTTTFRKMPGLSLAFVNCSGFHSERTRELARDGSDDLVVVINTEGRGCVSQFGRLAQLRASDGAMLSTGNMCAVSYPDAARYMLLSIPRQPIAALVKDPEAAAGRLLRKETESLQLLTNYVSGGNSLTFANPELRHAFITHVYDLLALTLGAGAEAAEQAAHRGLPAARLSAIKADVIDRIADERLSIVDIAGRRGVTPRYVQMPFETEGTTFSEYVLGQRLARAHRMLADPRFSGRAISAIAYDAGFANLSYFNRAFRRRFGETPSDARARAQGERGA